MADEHFERYRKELDKLNLKTTSDLEKLVAPLIKEATKITLKNPSKMPKDSHLKSHFGGQPYFEKGEEWPRARDDFRENRELEFVFQIYNESGIALPENIKLVQFYYDLDDEFSFETKDGGWLVKIYEDIRPENYLFIAKPKKNKTVKYCEIKHKQIKSLPDWQGLDVYSPNASKLSCVLDEDEPWKNYDKIAKKLVGEKEICSQLGGYAYWVQGDDNPGKDNFTFLFQIDSEDNAGLMWGDCGLIYVFYDARNKKTEFVLQCY